MLFVEIFNIYNHFHNILRPLDILSYSFSPQVKRCAITTYKVSIQELPHELLNDLRPTIKYFVNDCLWDHLFGSNSSLTSSNLSSLTALATLRPFTKFSTKYFEAFWCFTKFSYHRKSNDVRLLLIKWYIPVASQVAKQLKTFNLRKLGNIRKVSKLHIILA